jgi:hypothetical protein
MRMLSPPLSVIESTLFDPSCDLIRRWVEADPSLSAADQAALAADGTARALRADWEAGLAVGDAPAPALTGPMPPLTLPPHLAAKVRQRVATRARGLSPEPRPGLILRVDQASGPTGPLGWDLAHPFAVLLSEPNEHPAVWYGWLMSWETDYASHWDLLLEEADEPYDPLAVMVQTWNPVHLYVPSAGAPLGQLSPGRLVAARNLANDLGETHPDPSGASSGTLVQRTTTGGHLVLTGTPLGAADDPRWRYQELYFEAAGLLRDLARYTLQALAPRPAPSSPWARLLDGLKAAAGSVGIGLEPVPVAVLGEESLPADTGQPLRLGDLVELRLIQSPDGSAAQIHLILLLATPLRVGLARSGHVRQQARLTPEAPAADLFAGLDQGLSLFIRDDQDRPLLTWDLGVD